MIGRLTGVIAEKSPPQVLIDVNGVGYELDVPMSTFYNLPGLGERATLLTHFVVREDAQLLFGFLTRDERTTFRQLVKISGVGPRTALSHPVRAERRRTGPGRQPAGKRPPGQGAGHRQEDGRAAAARTQRQARPRPRAARVHPPATRRPTSCRRWWRWATTSARRAAALKALPADVGVSDGIKLALKALNR